MTTEVVLFDAGGTLFTEVETRDEVYARVFAEHGLHLNAAGMASLRHAVHDDMPEFFAGAARYTDLWFREFIRRLLSKLESAADPEGIRRELAEYFHRPEHFAVFPDTIPALEELGSLGLRLGVVSNWNHGLQELLAELSLVRHFECVVISSMVGASKPDRLIFRHALRCFGIAPAKALHVGDHPVNDLLGARRCGIPALLVDRRGHETGGIGTIRSLEDISGHVLRAG